MEPKFLKDEKIIVSFYEREYTGVVLKDQTSSIVLLAFDGETRPRWFHATSVRRA